MDLNTYFKKPKKFKNKIIVITVKDSANVHYGKFTNRKLYHLEKNLNFRDSLIAVIDMKNNFVYENVSNTLINGTYQVKDNYIDIVSAGYKTGNVSSVKVKNKEFSLGKRGLNVVIFNQKLRCIDSFYVDSYEDKTLLVKRG